MSRSYFLINVSEKHYFWDMLIMPLKPEGSLHSQFINHTLWVRERKNIPLSVHIIEWWEPSNEGECNDLLSLSYLTLCLWSIAAVYLYVRADREERKRGEGRNLNGIFITGKTRGNFKFLLNLTSWGATAAATVVAAACSYESARLYPTSNRREHQRRSSTHAMHSNEKIYRNKKKDKEKMKA